ncbi:hypothetical protein DCAR_0104328 [Daucus carota subsp. sativus]|uniref:RING-type domain-containing protein n=1 Tax=Daucus carota subsp. sativus TaxID=79200 RepID=A0AAF1AM29_DAUCS|nr:hypothetical protein DCAR_0104328 [Daucus carota subsp. sativus]
MYVLFNVWQRNISTFNGLLKAQKRSHQSKLFVIHYRGAYCFNLGGRLAAPGDEEEYIIVHLPDIRKDVQCPICLGIIRKTRTIMDCLHRFCKKCIDKSFRLGNHECPSCRRHCASRRSLRDDPKYDELISALYPDIEKYEEEETAFHEEERIRNEQLQTSIAQTTHRQSEARGKKRSRGKKH